MPFNGLPHNCKSWSSNKSISDRGFLLARLAYLNFLTSTVGGPLHPSSINGPTSAPLGHLHSCCLDIHATLAVLPLWPLLVAYASKRRTSIRTLWPHALPPSFPCQSGLDYVWVESPGWGWSVRPHSCGVCCLACLVPLPPILGGFPFCPCFSLGLWFLVLAFGVGPFGPLIYLWFWFWGLWLCIGCGLRGLRAPCPFGGLFFLPWGFVAFWLHPLLLEKKHIFYNMQRGQKNWTPHLMEREGDN